MSNIIIIIIIIAIFKMINYFSIVIIIVIIIIETIKICWLFSSFLTTKAGKEREIENVRTIIDLFIILEKKNEKKETIQLLFYKKISRYMYIYIL